MVARHLEGRVRPPLNMTPSSTTTPRIPYFWAFLIAIAACALNGGCSTDKSEQDRPLGPWAFRSVLDRKPRMLTLAFDTSLYAAYDLQTCTLYKVWKGGVLMEGAAYTDKKNVQPTSWGKVYAIDSSGSRQWVVRQRGKKIAPVVSYRGYRLLDGAIQLHYRLILAAGDTIQIEERPDFVRDRHNRPGLVRTFHGRNISQDTYIA